MKTDNRDLIDYPKSNKRVHIALILGAIIATLALAGCVSQKKYDAALQDIAKLKVDSSFQDYKYANTTFAQDGVIFEQQKELEAKAAKLDSLQKVVASQNRDLIARKDLINKLRNSQWEATEQDGQLVIQLKNDIVFESGSSMVSSEGKEVISSIAKAVQNSDEPLELWVVGHTDSQPIAAESKDNWDLSAERALEVVRELVRNEVAPAAITASAKSKYDPRAPNKNGLTKLLNRRTEIIIVPSASPYATLESLLKQ